MTEHEWLTPEEVKQDLAPLRVSIQAVRGWLRAGDLPSIKVGRRFIRINRAVYEDFKKRLYAGEMGTAEKPKAEQGRRRKTRSK